MRTHCSQCHQPAAQARVGSFGRRQHLIETTAGKLLAVVLHHVLVPSEDVYVVGSVLKGNSDTAERVLDDKTHPAVLIGLYSTYFAT